MTKVTVDFWKEEVKYSGRFEEYTVADFLEMAQVKQDKRCDFTPDRSEEMDEEEAKRVDGQIRVTDYPCNKLAVVSWAYIREEQEEEDDE